MLAGLIIVPLVSVFTAKPDAAKVAAVFSCYEEQVLVPQNRSLVIDSAEEEESIQHVHAPSAAAISEMV